MATRTIGLGGGNWSATTTWVEGAVPGSGDDVVATAVSGALTIDAGASCLTLDFTNYASTATHGAGVDLTVAGTKLLLVAGMTYTLGNAATSRILFTKSSAGTVAITSAGKTLGNVTTASGLSSSSATYQLQDASTLGSTATWTHSAGTLDTNGKAFSWGLFSSSNANPRTLTLGASSGTVTGDTGTPWDCSTRTNMTLNAGTSTITFTGRTITFSPGPAGYNNVTWTPAGAAAACAFSWSTVQNPACTTFTQNVGTGTSHLVSQSSSNALILTNLTVNSISTAKRTFWATSVLGTARPMTLSGTWSAPNGCDFQDIAVTGTAAPLAGSFLGDMGGNSGITFPASISQTYPTTATSAFSTASWPTRSPLPQDDVTFSGLTFSGSPTITMDLIRMCRNLDFTGSSGAVTFSPSVTVEQQGSLTLTANVTLGGSNAWRMNSRDADRTITSAGRSRGGLLDIRAVGRTVTITDSWNQTGGSQSTVTRGTLTLADGGTYTFVGLGTTGGATLNLGNGTTVNCTSGSAPWSIVAGTLNAGTSTLNIATTTAAAGSVFTFAGGGASYNVVNIGQANKGFAVAITGANTFNPLNLAVGMSVTWPSGTTNTLGSGGLSATGAPNVAVYLPGVSGNYVSAPDSAALSIAGDIDIRVRVAMDSWAPAAQSVVVGKYNSVGNQRSYAFVVETTGKLGLNASGDGATLGIANGVDSSVATGFAAGTANWIRVTRSGTAVKFYTAPDNASMPTSWIQLGTTQTAASSGSIFDSTAALVLGSFDGASGLTAAKFYRAQIRNNILDDGTGIQFDANFTAKAFGANAFTESSTNAATVSITGNQAQVGDGRIQMVSSTPGTQWTISKTSGGVSANYVSLTDSNATGGANWWAGPNSVSVSNNSGWVFTGPTYALAATAGTTASASRATSAARSAASGAAASGSRVVTASRTSTSGSLGRVSRSSTLGRAGASAAAGSVGRSAALSRSSTTRGGGSVVRTVSRVTSASVVALGSVAFGEAFLVHPGSATVASRLRYSVVVSDRPAWVLVLSDRETSAVEVGYVE